MGAEIGSIEEAPVPAGDALRAEYTVDVALPDGGTVPTDGVQYYVVDRRSDLRRHLQQRERHRRARRQR